MKPTLLLSLAALTFFGPAQASVINLVTNGGFEQGAGGIGSFDGWQTVLGDAATFVDSSGQTGAHPGQASDGLWSAYFGSTAASGGSSLSQTFATIARQTYILTFDFANDNGGQPASNSLQASVGGVQEFSAVNLPEQDYTHRQFAFVAAGSNATLMFSAFNDQSYLQLDNVAVMAAPEPSGLFLMLMGALVMAISTAFMNRRRAR